MGCGSGFWILFGRLRVACRVLSAHGNDELEELAKRKKRKGWNVLYIEAKPEVQGNEDRQPLLRSNPPKHLFTVCIQPAKTNRVVFFSLFWGGLSRYLAYGSFGFWEGLRGIESSKQMCLCQ